MPFWAWSWLLTAVGVTGLWMAGSRNKWGWAVGLFAQSLWFSYAIATEQWGFIPGCLAYGTMYARNLRAWWQAEAHA